MSRSNIVNFMLGIVVLLPLVPAGQTATQEVPARFVPVTNDMLRNPNPADWPLWRRTTNSWGYSPLDQINGTNVGRLTLVWSRPLGPGNVQEGTPLVYNGVMYMPSPNDLVQALDAATGDLKWEYRREWPQDLNQYIPFPAINRNLAIYGNLIIDTGSDNFVYALDAVSGTVVWETQMLDYRRGAQHSSGPIIANGRVIAGRSCEPEGGPEACIITAHDAVTGKESWRTRTIPAPGEPGNESWGNVPFEDRKHVGMWMVPSYDPELNLIYVGTSVTAPAPKFMLDGNDKQYLYHNSTLALNADTGKIVWYYQHLVDHWDLDHPFERLLVDTVVAPDAREVTWINPSLRAGERRRVMTGIPGKTGLVYTLDRETGEFLWARPTVPQTVVSSIDGATGKVTVNPEALFTAVDQQRLICPSLNGGKNFPAGVYSPLTNTMYYPLQQTCMTSTAVTDPNSTYRIRNQVQIAAGTTNVGTLQAISAETGKVTWKYEQRAGMTSLVATGGGLIFGGDANGRFRAFDQNTGRVLWEVSLGSAVTGYPITYAANGRQYVAVSTGASLVTSATNRLAPELRPGVANTLFIFALPN